MTKKTLIITLSSLVLLGAGVGTYLLIKRRKIKNLSSEEKLKLVHKSLKEDKDFGVDNIVDFKDYKYFLVNKYIKNFKGFKLDNGQVYYEPNLAFSNKNYGLLGDKILINFSYFETGFVEGKGYESVYVNGLLDLGLNTTITLVFYPYNEETYQDDSDSANPKSELFRKKIIGRNSAIALKKAIEYMCSDKVSKELKIDSLKYKDCEYFKK